MKTQHAVAPWHVGIRMAPGQVFDATGTCVADRSPCVTEAEARANAEHIVRCVNAHDALVRAVEACLLRDDIADCELGEQLRAALALVQS